MACWIVADDAATIAKIATAHEVGVRVTTGGGPFEVAVAMGELEAYLQLCANMGFDRIECGAGFTDLRHTPEHTVRLAKNHGLDVQFELGGKHTGAFDDNQLDELIEQGKHWLDAGAVELVIEARENAADVGLFDPEGGFSARYADRIAAIFGLEQLSFEAPNKASQFALIDHFGTAVRLSNVRLEELLRVEIYRRGLHSDAFRNPLLRPGGGTSK
jgi:phosphosulfolactate synthase